MILGAGAAELPVARHADELRTAISTGAAVVQAPPGTGKTTYLPPLVADMLAGRADARVVVTQPRRVAVRAAARHLAQLTGTRLGELVGYSVRGESRTSRTTRVEFVTPGLLVRRLLGDPEIPGIGAVILDEVHERGLDSDLLVGMLTEVAQLRDDLTLVAMSATLDSARFAELLHAPVVAVEADLFPLETRYAPPDTPRLDDRGVTPAFLDHVARTAAREAGAATVRDPSIDALVFLPGAREVSRVAGGLRSMAPQFDVLELNGQVPPAEQDRAVSGRANATDPPRIIISTAIAESSLTVPGVRLVIDAGLSREVRRDSARGMSGLVTIGAARSSLTQRAGRAARTGPGTVVRCFSPADEARAPQQARPEIQSADLTQAALTLACWGAPRGEGLALPTPPPATTMADAEEALRTLGAIDSAGRATAHGRRLAEVPADPRIAQALLTGTAAVGAETASEVAAVLADDYRPVGGDLPHLLRDLRSGRGRDVQRWRSGVRQLQGLAPRSGASPVTPPLADEDAVGLVVALAFPAWVAHLEDGTYLLASGTRAALPPGSSLAGSEWLAVAEAQRAGGRAAAGTGAVIRAAAPLAEADALEIGARLLTEDTESTYSASGVTARRIRRLGAITLSTTAVRPDRPAVERAVLAALRHEGTDVLAWSDSAVELRRRLGFLHHRIGAPWPDMSDPALIDRAGEWLAPAWSALANGRTPDLTTGLRAMLPWPEAARLDELAPERLTVASGRRVRIDYPAADDADGAPVVAVKLQECFGWDASPRIAGGRAPIVFHLLSPAGRPLAVTGDLASFWSGPYHDVRKEMRGRYPKHPWPEDPTTAEPTRRTSHARRRS